MFKKGGKNPKIIDLLKIMLKITTKILTKLVNYHLGANNKVLEVEDHAQSQYSLLNKTWRQHYNTPAFLCLVDLKINP